MTTFATWFHMHGYAIYLWPAYGLVTAILFGHFLISIRQGRRARAQLRSRFRRS